MLKKQRQKLESQYNIPDPDVDDIIIQDGEVGVHRKPNNTKLSLDGNISIGNLIDDVNS